MTKQKIFVKLYNDGSETIFELFTTMKMAEAWAEPIRIAFPDAHINIVGSVGELPDFSMHTTWNDQMKEFPLNEVYTANGKELQKKALVGFNPDAPITEEYLNQFVCD